MPLTNRNAYAESSDFAVSVPTNRNTITLIQEVMCFQRGIFDGRIRVLEYLFPYEPNKPYVLHL